jgi:hypothetical protein
MDFFPVTENDLNDTNDINDKILNVVNVVGVVKVVFRITLKFYIFIS